MRRSLSIASKLFRTRKGLVWLTSAMLVTMATGVLAAVLWTQDVSISTGSQDSDVTFLDGGGGVLDFAEVTIGTGGVSASIALTGVAGAANFQVSDLLQIDNADLTQDYTISLARSTVPDLAITSLVYTVLDTAGDPVRVYDAAAAASATAFTLPAGDTYDIRIDMVVTAGTAVGALTGFDLEFTISPV